MQAASRQSTESEREPSQGSKIAEKIALAYLTVHGTDGTVMGFEEWTKLVSDLLCIRDGVLSHPEETKEAVNRVAVEVGRHFTVPEGQQTITLGNLLEFARLLEVWHQENSWPDEICKAGGKGLPSLRSTEILAQLDSLRSKRQVPCRMHLHCMRLHAHGQTKPISHQRLRVLSM